MSLVNAAISLVNAFDELSASKYKCAVGSFEEVHIHPEDWEDFRKAVQAVRALLVGVPANPKAR